VDVEVRVVKTGKEKKCDVYCAHYDAYISYSRANYVRFQCMRQGLCVPCAIVIKFGTVCFLGLFLVKHFLIKDSNGDILNEVREVRVSTVSNCVTALAYRVAGTSKVSNFVTALVYRVAGTSNVSNCVTVLAHRVAGTSNVSNC
jgi:hypothetical protein